MRIVMLVAALLLLSSPARAEEPTDERSLESINDYGGAWTLRGGFDHSVLMRVVLSGVDTRDAAEFFYGLRWSKRKGISYALLAGYGYAKEGWGPTLALRKLFATSDLKWRMHMESYVRHVDGWSQEGYYAADYMVGGIHVLNDGMEWGYGGHLGSGHGLHPFKFEMRITVGATDGMPTMLGAFYMGLDFD